jgi:dienelactone hydrolase
MRRPKWAWLPIWVWLCWMSSVVRAQKPVLERQGDGSSLTLLGESPTDDSKGDRGERARPESKPGPDGTWDGKEEPVAFPPFATWARGVAASRIQYWCSGLPITAFLLRPSPTKGEKTLDRLPLVIANRGGYGKDVGAWKPLGLAGLAYLVQQVPAVVLASQYRGASARPSGERDHDGYMGADLSDVICLDKLAHSIEGVDPKRIGMYGFSRGGAMTFLAWPRMPGVRGVVTVGGLVDFEDWLAYLADLQRTAPGGQIQIGGAAFVPKKILEECRGAIAKDLYLADKEGIKSPRRVTDEMFRVAVRKRSPITAVNVTAAAKRGPILLMHGGADKNNPVRQAKNMKAALERAGADVHLSIIDDAGHMMIGEGPDDRVATPRGQEIMRQSSTYIADFFRTRIFATK